MRGGGPPLALGEGVPLPSRKRWASGARILLDRGAPLPSRKRKLAVAEAGDAVALFQPAQAPGGQGDQDEVVEAHGQEDFRIAEGVRGQHLGFAHELVTGHEHGKGAVLDEIDDLVAAAGQGTAGGLGDDDPEHGLEGGHAQGLGGLDLALTDGEQCPADVFRMIGGAAKDEAQQGSAVGFEIDAHLGQGIVDHHQLHGQGHAADDGGVPVAQPAAPGAAEGPQASQGHAAHEAQDTGGDDEGDGHFQALVEGRDDVLGEKGDVDDHA